MTLLWRFVALYALMYGAFGVASPFMPAFFMRWRYFARPRSPWPSERAARRGGWPSNPWCPGVLPEDAVAHLCSVVPHLNEQEGQAP